MTAPAGMPRVCVLAADLGGRHGWAEYSTQIVRALAQAGVPLTVLAAEDSDPLALAAIISRGVPAYPVLPSLTPLRRGLVPRGWVLAPRLRRLAAGAAVVHALAEPYAALGRGIAGGRPLVITAHGSYIQPEPWAGRAWAWAFARAFSRAARVVCVSEYTRGVAAARWPAPAEVVANGVDAARFAHLPAWEDRPRTGGFGIISVGAVKPRKGTLELVRAVAAARSSVAGLHLHIVGSLTADATYVARVQAEIAALGVGDCVMLHGAVPGETLLALMGAAHLAVLPSMNQGWQFEGFGLALLEASAAGLPVIGTRECGAADAVAHGETGLLVHQARIAEELPAAILAIATDPARAAAMGRAGRARAAAFSWAQAAGALAGVYRAVCGRGSEGGTLMRD